MRRITDFSRRRETFAHGLATCGIGAGVSFTKLRYAPALSCASSLLKPRVGSLSLIPGVLSLIPGVQSLIPGVQSLIPSLMSGVRSLIPGVQSLIPGVRPLIPGARSFIRRAPLLDWRRDHRRDDDGRLNLNGRRRRHRHARSPPGIGRLPVRAALAADRYLRGEAALAVRQRSVAREADRRWRRRRPRRPHPRVTGDECRGSPATRVRYADAGRTYDLSRGALILLRSRTASVVGPCVG
jgi:hypothetical protein